MGPRCRYQSAIVKKLQDVYREAIGLPPEPDPEFFRVVKQVQSKPSKSAKQLDADVDYRNAGNSDAGSSDSGKSAEEIPVAGRNRVGR